jgi:hypothetical protein
VVIFTVPKSRKTKITTLSKQFQNLEKQKKYHTVRTVPKSRKTKNTTLSEQFQNLEKQKLPQCQNRSKNSVVFFVFLDFGTGLSVWYFFAFLDFGTVSTVW